MPYHIILYYSILYYAMLISEEASWRWGKGEGAEEGNRVRGNNHNDNDYDNMGTLRTKILDFGGFDSSIILILRGETLMPKGDFPEMSSRQILGGIILVGRFGRRVRGRISLRTATEDLAPTFYSELRIDSRKTFLLFSFLFILFLFFFFFKHGFKICPRTLRGTQFCCYLQHFALVQQIIT